MYLFSHRLRTLSLQAITALLCFGAGFSCMAQAKHPIDVQLEETLAKATHPLEKLRALQEANGQWFVEMTNTYRRLLPRLNPHYQRLLTESQNQWRKFAANDAQLIANSGPYALSPAFMSKPDPDQQLYKALIALTRARAMELEVYAQLLDAP